MLFAACNIRDDAAKFNQLDRLRVLAIQSEPADLVVGDSATLNALVFEPNGRPIRYAWSWCPALTSIAEGSSCSIDEVRLRAAWATLGSDSELPAYDLGNAPTARFTHVFTPELVVRLCQALAAGSGADAVPLCLATFAPSIELRVTSGSQHVDARRSLELLVEPPEAAQQRNNNPVVPDELAVRLVGKAKPLSNDTPLRAGKAYDLRVAVDAAEAETFLPAREDGLDEPVPRQETMVMTWYVTQGDTAPQDGADVLGSDGAHTSFIDGSSRFEDLIRNRWLFPPTVHANAARLVLVLRDERGGVGWQQFEFALTGAK